MGKFRKRDFAIPIASASVTAEDCDYVYQALKSTRLSRGDYNNIFEDNFARAVGAKHAVSLSSGTAALHLALLALGVGEGDHVAIPEYTYVAVANAVKYVGATPVFYDINQATWNISLPDKVYAKAIIAVHTYGNPCDMDSIREVAKRSKCHVIEDCSQAIGSLYKGKHVGSFCDIATYSFFGSKTITTGEGGMITTNSSRIEDCVRHLSNQACKQNYFHDDLGFNYRMTNMQAAIGVSQLKRIKSFIEAKVRNHATYVKYLDPEKYRLQVTTQESMPGYWMTAALKLHGRIPWFISKMASKGIEVKSGFSPLVTLPHLGFTSPSPVTRMISERMVVFPSGTSLTPKEISHVCECANGS